MAACHSKKPEAMVKVVPGAPRGFRIRQLLHYIARSGEGQPENSVWLIDHGGQPYTDRAEVEALARAWSEEFRPEFRQIRELREERKLILAHGATDDLTKLDGRLAKLEKKLRNDGQASRKSRDVMHLVLSAKAANTPQNQARVLAAAVHTANGYFGNHEYVIGMHQDAKHPHVHLVVKCKPRAYAAAQGARKLRLNKPELLLLRTVWARELTREGLDHVATLRQDRPHVMQEVAAGRASIKSESKGWYAASIAGLDEGIEFVAKRREDLKNALERAQDHEEAKKIRAEIGLRLNDLRALVRQQTENGDKARFAAFNELRRVERELKQTSDPKMRLKEIAAKAGPNKAIFELILKAVEKGYRLHQIAEETKKERQKAAAYAAHQTSMQKAWAELRKGGLPREEYMTAAKVLAIHDEAMRQAFGLAPAIPEPRQTSRLTNAPARRKAEGMER